MTQSKTAGPVRGAAASEIVDAAKLDVPNNRAALQSDQGAFLPIGDVIAGIVARLGRRLAEGRAA